MPHVAFGDDQPGLKQVLLDDDAVGPVAFRRPLVVGGTDELAVDDRAGQRLPNVARPAEDEHRCPRQRQPVAALDNPSPVVQELHIAEVASLVGVAVGEERPVPAHRLGMEELVRLQLLQDPAVVPARSVVLREALLAVLCLRQLVRLRPASKLLAIHVPRLPLASVGATFT